MHSLHYLEEFTKRSPSFRHLVNQQLFRGTAALNIFHVSYVSPYYILFAPVILKAITSDDLVQHLCSPPAWKAQTKHDSYTKGTRFIVRLQIPNSFHETVIPLFWITVGLTTANFVSQLESATFFKHVNQNLIYTPTNMTFALGYISSCSRQYT